MANDSDFIGQSRTFVSEAVSELKRVAWPSREETLAFTWVVIAVVAFTSVYLGLVDWVISLGMRFVF